MTDGNLVSNTATVTVNVAPVNDAPVAQNDAVTVSEDVPFS
ncbi:Ig-like domain-containing protein [Pseudomonas stutzeri]|nr:Ig-like domain-containing protein [Stutzerimonas stutzeri]